jgi:hypothetical protein
MQMPTLTFQNLTVHSLRMLEGVRLGHILCLVRVACIRVLAIVIVV